MVVASSAASCTDGACPGTVDVLAGLVASVPKLLVLLNVIIWWWMRGQVAVVLGVRRGVNGEKRVVAAVETVESAAAGVIMRGRRMLLVPRRVVVSVVTVVGMRMGMDMDWCDLLGRLRGRAQNVSACLPACWFLLLDLIK